MAEWLTPQWTWGSLSSPAKSVEQMLDARVSIPALSGTKMDTWVYIVVLIPVVAALVVACSGQGGGKGR